jgi:tetratricopeptide (TPR) repeat protein
MRPSPAPVAAALALLLAGAPMPRAQPAPMPDAPAPGTDAPAADDTASLPVPPVPPRIAESPDYDRCLDMVPADPSGARNMAVSWAASGGGEPAAHCLALAEIELGSPETGAATLDKLAIAGAASGASRAELLSQAAQAWTMAGQAEKAFASASEGLSLSPDNVELRITRAMAAAALKNLAGATDDLTVVLDLDPKRVDALTLRAGAYRGMDRLDLARADIDRAFALDPENPETLLERGIIRQRGGDLAGARSDWEKAADLGEDTSTGDLAQQNLALLDAGPRQ